MHNFTPVSAFAGGLLIGLSAALLWLANGRIAGISGILANLPGTRRDDAGWRVAFLTGLILAPLGYVLFVGAPIIQVDAHASTIVAGGLLVGFGTQLGSGCTSGHGVCGLARLSPRSLVSTCLFMLAGFITAFVLHHLVEG